MTAPASPRSGATAQTIGVNGALLVADFAGVLYWPAARTLVVADLHFEKGSHFAGRGALLPPYDTRATLDRLARALDRYAPQTVICLGDSFHDGDAAGRLDGDDRARLRGLTAAHDWIWIEGNHDPLPPTDLGGRVMAELSLGPLTFRHRACPRGPAEGEVSGHFHPKARLSLRGRSVQGRCFATDRRRLILPAFGAYTGGLNVLDPAIRGLFADGLRVLLIGRDRIHRIAEEKLRN
jgi:DNA ligase-associated metallophosphoesterase